MWLIGVICITFHGRGVLCCTIATGGIFIGGAWLVNLDFVGNFVDKQWETVGDS